MEQPWCGMPVNFSQNTGSDSYFLHAVSIINRNVYPYQLPSGECITALIFNLCSIAYRQQEMKPNWHIIHQIYTQLPICHLHGNILHTGNNHSHSVVNNPEIQSCATCKGLFISACCFYYYYYYYYYYY